MPAMPQALRPNGLSSLARALSGQSRQTLSQVKTAGGSPRASARVLHADGTAALVHQAQAGSASQLALVVYLSLQSTTGAGVGAEAVTAAPVMKLIPGCCWHVTSHGSV
jgi:hypothetical protein